MTMPTEDARDFNWLLSSFVAEIGTSALRSERLGMLARPLLERLVAQIEADDRVPTVAHLAVLGGADVIYAARVQGFRAPTTVSSVGVRLPAQLTASGRALLAEANLPNVHTESTMLGAAKKVVELAA